MILNALQFESLTLIVQIKKELPNVLGRYKAMTDSDLSESIRFLSRDMRAYEFLLRQVVHKKYLVFLRQDEKGFDFYHRPWRIKKNTAMQSFWKKTNSRIFFNWTCSGCSLIWKIPSRTRWTNSTIIGFLSQNPMYWYWWKPNPDSTKWCLGWSHATWHLTSIDLLIWP